MDKYMESTTDHPLSLAEYDGSTQTGSMFSEIDDQAPVTGVSGSTAADNFLQDAYLGSSQVLTDHSTPAQLPTFVNYQLSESHGDFIGSLGTVNETRTTAKPYVPGDSSLRSSSSRGSFVDSRSASVSSIPMIPPVSLDNFVHTLAIEDDEEKVPFAIRAAWIPSERTSGALQAIAANVAASDFLGSDQLTKPGILLEKLFVNPAFDLALRLVGTLPPSLIPENPEELLNKGDIGGLFEKGFYSSAANLCAKLLYSFDQGYGRAGSVTLHTPFSLRLWYYRIASLVLCGQVELAAKEMEAFHDFDNPDLYLEYHQKPVAGANFGSMVPFRLRLLHARIPQQLGTTKVTLERLFAMRDTIDRMLKDKLPPGIAPHLQSQFVEFWTKRKVVVFYYIASAAISCEDFDTAVSVLGMLMKFTPEHLPKLWHNLGLLYCHVGIPKCSRVCFEAEMSLLPVGSRLAEYHGLMHKAILTVCDQSPVQSQDIYRDILERFPNDSPAANGVAVAYFYAGKMAEAIAFLENLVFTRPKLFLTEQSMANLVAMYELQNVLVKTKKLRLLSLICQYMPDGFGVSGLKLDV